jgi:hypothetical protein
MAHGERSRAYGRVGSSAARAFRTAMAGAPFDRPRQERAEGRRRCARGSWPNRRTGMAKRTVVGCRQRNREGASRSAERSGGMVGIGRDGTGRTWRGSAGAGRHTASRRMVEMGTCGRGQSNSRSPRAGPSKNPTTHSPSYCTSFSFSLGPGRSEQPPGPDSGGGWKAGLAASELGYEAPLPTWLMVRAGGWSESGGTAWAELGEDRQGREDTQRAGGWSRWAHAVEGNQIRGHLELDLRRTQRHTPPYTVPRSRSPLARGRVETPVSPRASSATGPFSHTLTHTVPRYRSPLARGRTGNPPVPLRGGVGRPASPRASSATRPLSPPGFGSVRFGSVRFGSVRLVSSPAPPRRPPTIGEVDREEPHRPRL